MDNTTSMEITKSKTCYSDGRLIDEPLHQPLAEPNEQQPDLGARQAPGPSVAQLGTVGWRLRVSDD